MTNMLGFAFGNALSKGTKTQVIFVSVVSLDKYIWLHEMTQVFLMLTLQTSCILRTGPYHTDQGKKKGGKGMGDR
jgi:hypothetical protein